MMRTGSKQPSTNNLAAPVRIMEALNANIAVTMITATLPKPENASWGLRIADLLPSGLARGRQGKASLRLR